MTQAMRYVILLAAFVTVPFMLHYGDSSLEQGLMKADTTAALFSFLTVCWRQDSAWLWRRLPHGVVALVITIFLNHVMFYQSVEYYTNGVFTASRAATWWGMWILVSGFLPAGIVAVLVWVGPNKKLAHIGERLKGYFNSREGRLFLTFSVAWVGSILIINAIHSLNGYLYDDASMPLLLFAPPILVLTVSRMVKWSQRGA